MAVNINANIENLSSVKKRISVEIGPDDVNRRIRDAYRNLGKRVRVPGFRPGKVPMEILERRFGRQVTDDLTRTLINETLPQVLQDNNIEPVTFPLIENDVVKKGEAFKYTATIEVNPEIDIKDEHYKGIEIQKEKLNVTEEDVEEQLKRIQFNYGKLVSLEEDRGLQEGDFAVLEYEAFEDGNPIEDVKASNFLLKIGSNDFHPDFEKSLLGLKKGEERNVSVQFPSDYKNLKLAGKSVDFKVKILDIKVMDVPPLNDEFAKMVGPDFNTIDELKARIKEEFIKREEQRIDAQMKLRALNMIGENVEFELPDSLVEIETTKAINNIKENLKRSGSSLEKAGLSEEKLRKDLRPSSEKKVKNMLILEHIARKENLTVTDDEIMEAYRDIAEKLGQDLQVVIDYYQQNQLVGSLRRSLLEEKTLNYIIDNAKINIVEKDKLIELDSGDKGKKEEEVR